MKEGVRFYKSSNNVILTEGKGGSGVLPPEYFRRVTDRKGNVLLES
jgi:2'-phosphotransferase